VARRGGRVGRARDELHVVSMTPSPPRAHPPNAWTSLPGHDGKTTRSGDVWSPGEARLWTGTAWGGGVAMNEAAGTPRRTIASFERYQDAEALVDRLAAKNFPVERLVIVGRDLELVEQVTSRLTPGRVVAGGMGSGAVLGAVSGLFFGVVFPGVPA